MAWIVPIIIRERRNRARIMRQQLRDVLNPFDVHDNL